MSFYAKFNFTSLPLCYPMNLHGHKVSEGADIKLAMLDSTCGTEYTCATYYIPTYIQFSSKSGIMPAKTELKYCHTLLRTIK